MTSFYCVHIYETNIAGYLQCTHCGQLFHDRTITTINTEQQMTEPKTRIEFKSYKDVLAVNCPDEDGEMSIVISNGRKSIFSLNLNDAKSLAKFINNHIKIAKKI